jgi:hypothetical protein
VNIKAPPRHAEMGQLDQSRHVDLRIRGQTRIRRHYFLVGGDRKGEGVGDADFLSFFGFFASRLLFF